MGRSIFNQITQVRSSAAYDDTVAPTEANFETNPTTLEGDLNNLRSAIQTLLGETNWFDTATRDVATLETDLADLEGKLIICGTQVLTNVTVAANVAATGILTLTGLPIDTETTTINSKVYTWQDTLTDVDGNVHIGASASDSLDNLIAAIDLGAGAGVDYAASMTDPGDVDAAAGAGDTMDVTAEKGGTFANTFATTQTLTNGTWGAATLTGGAGDVKVLVQASSETPTVSAGVDGGIGAVVGVLAVDVGTAALTEEAGANAIQPKNLIKIRDAVTKDAITSSGGFEIWGLLQAETGVLQGESFNDTDKQAQITFVNNDGADDLETADGADIGGKVIEYLYGNRVTLDTLPDNCAWPPNFIDQAAVTDVTLNNAIDNQGTTPATQGTNIDIDMGLGFEWAFRDNAQLDLLNVTEGTTGGDSEVAIGSAVDLYDNDAIDVDFASGASVNSGGTRPVDVGVIDGVVESTAGDLKLDSASSLVLSDSFQAGSGFGTDLTLADSSTEWDNFESQFGEASILSAIVQASKQENREKTVGTINLAVAADVDVDSGVNIDTALGDYSEVGTFVDDVDIFVNGQLQFNGANAAANNDVYPGTTPGSGLIRFEYALIVGDVITMVVHGELAAVFDA